MKAFLVDAPPYLHSRDSVGSTYLTYGMAVAPAVAVSTAQAGLEGLFFAALCLAVAVGVETLCARWLRGAAHTSRLAALYDGALFVVLVGSRPAPAAVGAFAAALFFAKMIFGGVGRALFSPACLAWLLAAAAPDGAPPLARGPWVSGALLLGAGLLLGTRLVWWEEAAAFLAVAWISAAVRGVPAGALTARADWILAAFFLLPALGPRPLERRAAALLAAAAAMLAATFDGQGAGRAGVPMAVLLANAAAPAFNGWVEQWRAR